MLECQPALSRVGPNLIGLYYLLLRLPVSKSLFLHEDNISAPENFLVNWIPHSVAELIVAVSEESVVGRLEVEGQVGSQNRI